MTLLDQMRELRDHGHDFAERRTFELAELRVEGSGESRKLVWYPAVYDSLSGDLGGFREKIQHGAFTKTLQEADIRALFNHNPDFVLGRNRANTLKLRSDKTGLYSEVTPPATQWAQDLMVSVERGDITQGSFGFRVIRDKWEQGGKPADMWAYGDDVVRTLLEVQLFDVSLVTFPAYPATDGAGLRSALASHGLDPDCLTRALVALRAGEDPGENRCALERANELFRDYVPVGPGDAHPTDGEPAHGHSLELLTRKLELLALV